RHTETVVPKNLNQIATAAAKGEKIAGVRIALQRLMHLQRKTIHAAAHVVMACRDPHAHTRGNGNHRRGIAFITVAARSGSTAAEIRKRTPRQNSSSMNGVAKGDAAGGGSLCSGPAIATGVKPM